MNQNAEIHEVRASSAAGIPMLLLLLALTFVALPTLFIIGLRIPAVLAAIVVFFLLVRPVHGAAEPGRWCMQLFGRYVGTVREEGLRWANPFYSKRPVSLRVRNFESNKLKVNELEGSPIEIASVVVWQVVDSAEALFQVDDYENFVHVQSESALRQMATTYPYDLHDEVKIALRSHSTEISEHLQKEIQERLAQAGVKVIEARISHLAYAPEIANAMLRRQQANAVIDGAHADRRTGAVVSMVELSAWRNSVAAAA
jgi:regulator of protease activity HflC (stomatin/prohibitin superfamily)